MHSNRKPIRQRSLSGGLRRKRLPSPAQIRPVSAVPLDQIKPHPRNPRTHSKRQIRQIADSIHAVGFTAPLLIDETGTLLAGHGRLEAARMLGLMSVPVIVIDGLTEPRKRALLLADNRIAQSAGWDRERLAELGRRGAQGVREHYGVGQMAERALAVYRNIANAAVHA